MPYSHLFHPGNPQYRSAGERLLSQGKVAAVVLAGGQGTRFGGAGIKGACPISSVKRKSLFQLLAERAVAASRRYGHPLPLAIMTSNATHEESVAHFERAHFFGLDPKTISFFRQSDLPFLDPNGAPVITREGTPLVGPSGNGDMPRALIASGLLAAWRRAGIEIITCVQIDNPLADPFDAELIGLHAHEASDMTCVAVPRTSLEEKVGLFIEQAGHQRVIEYMECPESTRQDETLLANITYFACSRSFLERPAPEIPLHWVQKQPTHAQLAHLDTSPPWIWKSEYFLPDILLFAKKTALLLFAREHCFAPMKEAHGALGPEGVMRALLAKDRARYAEISGQPVDERRIFELAPSFWYPTDAMKSEWQGVPLPKDGYIEQKRSP